MTFKPNQLSYERYWQNLYATSEFDQMYSSPCAVPNKFDFFSSNLSGTMRD